MVKKKLKLHVLKVFFLTAICLHFPSIGPFAEENGPRRVTLKECIKIAMENHPELKMAREAIKESRADLKAAKAPSRVLVDGLLKSTQHTKVGEGGSPIKAGDQDYYVGLFAGAGITYKILDPTQSKKEQFAKTKVQLSRINNRKSINTIKKNVKIAYYQYALSMEGMELKKKLMEKFKSKLEKTILFHTKGQRPIQDVTKARVDFASSNLNYEKSRNSVNLAKIELLTAMGLVSGDLMVVPAEKQEMPELKYLLKDLFILSRNYSSDVQIAGINIDLMELSIDIAKRERYPNLSLFGQLGYENSDIIDGNLFTDKFNSERWGTSIYAGLQARFPIYSGGLIPGKIESAKARYNRAVINEKQIEIQLQALIRQYEQVLREMKKQLELADLMKINALKHLDFAQQSYERGVGSQLQLQDAEMSVLKAELASVEAKYGYLITMAKISDAVGLEEEFLCK